MQLLRSCAHTHTHTHIHMHAVCTQGSQGDAHVLEDASHGDDYSELDLLHVAAVGPRSTGNRSYGVSLILWETNGHRQLSVVRWKFAPAMTVPLVFIFHTKSCVQHHLTEKEEAIVRKDMGKRAWELAAMQECLVVAQESWALRTVQFRKRW